MGTTSATGKRIWAVLTLVGLLFVAVGCGDDDSAGDGGAAATTAAGSPSSTAATETSASAPTDVDPNGILRYGMAMLGKNFDPANPTPPAPHVSLEQAVYDTLLRASGEHGALEPGLAESVEIVDPSTVRIVLHEGIRFTDGTPLDAEAAKIGLEYVRDSDNGTLDIERKNIESITVEGPLTLTLHLDSPVAGAIVPLLAGPTFMLASPKALADGVDLKTNPVGAGPFMLDEFRPDQFARLVKNPDFFQADSIRLAGIEFTDVPQGEATINALASGAVDVVDIISYPQAKQLRSDNITVESEKSDNIMVMAFMCKSRPPLDDVRVRHALNHAIDRDALNQLLYDGLGEPMAGWFNSDSPYHAEGLESFIEYDPDKARSLLAEAGAPNVSFESFYTQGAQRVAEILQAQWAEVGINVAVKPLTNSGDFYPDARAASMNIHFQERPGVAKVARLLEPGSVADVCNWNDPELNEALAAVRAARPDTPEAAEAWARVAQRTHETAAVIPMVFGVAAKVWNHDRVGDAKFMHNYAGKPVINFYSAYIKR